MLTVTEAEVGQASPEIQSRGLAKKGDFVGAEARLERATQSGGASERDADLFVALELWGMAQEARNAARSIEAAELAARAKKRLEKAAKAAQGDEESLHIAELRLRLAESFPVNETEIVERRTERGQRVSKAERGAQGEKSK